MVKNLREFAVENGFCLCINQIGTNKEFHHLYFSRVYEPLLEMLQSPVKCMLEIGIGGGFSIDLWMGYLQPSNFFAIDTNANILENIRARGWNSQNFILGDAYRPRIYRKLPNEFDLVIDDGPHVYRSLKAAVRIYTKKLRPGGVLVVEDIDDPEKVLSSLILSSPKKLICCIHLIDSRKEAREVKNSVALVIHAKSNTTCNFQFVHGNRIFYEEITARRLKICRLYFERLIEYFQQVIYYGIRHRILLMKKKILC